MTVYMVRRYEDQLDDGEFCSNGVDDQFFLVGIYTTRKKAEYVLNKLSEEERPGGDQIIEIEIDKTYPAGYGPWLGGGSYLE